MILHGLEWAKDVVEGKFVADKWVKLECERYIKRIEELQYTDEFRYYFDKKECSIIYGFCKLINYATGFYAGEAVYEHLAGFQFFILENIFCWKSKDNDYGRLVEELLLEIGRKSAKSFICALIEIIIMLRSPKFAQHAIAGKTRDISRLVKESMKELILASPAIKKYFKITRELITCTINNATSKALSGEANNINGLLLSTYIVDEVGNQETGDVVGALKLSQMSTKTRLAIYISTAYDLEVNIFKDMIQYHKDVLLGKIKAENTLSLLFELDEKDDYRDEKNWIKASPLQMTMDNGIEFLRGEFQKGLTIPSAMREFRIKILNQWLSNNEEEAYLDLNTFKKGAVEEIDFKGKEVVVSLDLSLTTDLTAVDMMYKENDKYYLKAIGILPEESLKRRREKFDYRAAQDRGECIITEGDIVDYNYVESFIRQIEDDFKCTIKCIVCDPYNGTQMMLSLAEDYEVIELKQTYPNLSPPTKEFRNEVYKGNIYYEKSKLLEWNVSNAVTRKDRNENEALDKANKNKQRIDLIAAAVFAFSECYKSDNDFVVQTI